MLVPWNQSNTGFQTYNCLISTDLAWDLIYVHKMTITDKLSSFTMFCQKKLPEFWKQDSLKRILNDIEFA